MSIIFNALKNIPGYHVTSWNMFVGKKQLEYYSFSVGGVSF